MSSFLYFAYGSNLLAKRIHINNPTAKRVDIGELLDYRLDFSYFSQRWKGCAATVVPQSGTKVWGAIWELEHADMDHLDKQEGVSDNIYKPISLTVTSPNGKEWNCRSYELVDAPPYTPELPSERYPSKIYLETIVNGARESKLPDDYIAKLLTIPTNGFNGPINISKQLIDH